VELAEILEFLMQRLDILASTTSSRSSSVSAAHMASTIFEQVPPGSSSGCTPAN
jgi:hypothetical protein